MDEEKENKLAEFFPFWENISDQQKQHIASGTVRKKYSAGENVHSGGGECLGGVLILSGSLRVYLMSEEGREVTLYRLYAGETCVLSAACVLKEITFDVFVDAEEESECLIVSGPVFAAVSAESAYVENFALRLAVKRFSDVVWVMQQIMFMSFDKRLALFLTEESEKTGSLEIHLTHEQIAKYMGSAREVVSRMLKYFSSEGLVSVSRGGVKILNAKALSAIAE